MQSSQVPNARANEMSVKITLLPDRVHANVVSV